MFADNLPTTFRTLLSLIPVAAAICCGSIQPACIRARTFCVMDLRLRITSSSKPAPAPEEAPVVWASTGTGSKVASARLWNQVFSGTTRLTASKMSDTEVRLA